MITIKKKTDSQEVEYHVVSARLTVEMVKKLDELAGAANMSRNALIVELLDNAMKQVHVV